MNLPHNKRLKQYARELRKAGNWAEAHMWRYIKKRQLNGHSFDRQITLGNYIVDFFCATARVAIEIDGESHDAKQEYDKKRDEYLKSLGLTVIHVQHMNVIQNFEYVWHELVTHPALQIKQSPHTPRQPAAATPLP